MAQQWRVGISGKQRKDVDLDLLIQAVIALGEQLRREAQEAQSRSHDPTTMHEKGGKTA